jgi:hypothetical protein
VQRYPEVLDLRVRGPGEDVDVMAELTQLVCEVPGVDTLTA